MRKPFGSRYVHDGPPEGAAGSGGPRGHMRVLLEVYDRP